MQSHENFQWFIIKSEGAHSVLATFLAPLSCNQDHRRNSVWKLRPLYVKVCLLRCRNQSECTDPSHQPCPPPMLKYTVVLEVVITPLQVVVTPLQVFRISSNNSSYSNMSSWLDHISLWVYIMYNDCQHLANVWLSRVSPCNCKFPLIHYIKCGGLLSHGYIPGTSTMQSWPNPHPSFQSVPCPLHTSCTPT